MKMAGQMLLQPLQAQDSGAANHRRLAKSPGPPARLAAPIDCNTSKNMWCVSEPEHQQGAGLLGVQCGHGDSPAGTAACMDPPIAGTRGAPKAGRPHPLPTIAPALAVVPTPLWAAQEGATSQPTAMQAVLAQTAAPAQASRQQRNGTAPRVQARAGLAFRASQVRRSSRVA